MHLKEANTSRGHCRKDNPARTQSVPAVLTLGQPRVNVKASGLGFVISKLLSFVNHCSAASSKLPCVRQDGGQDDKQSPRDMLALPL